MKILLLASILSIFGGCSTKAPSRSESNQIGATLDVSRSNLLDRAAGINAAIGFTAQALPESQEKTVILGFVDDQYSLLGRPKQATQTEFEKAASKLLSTDATERATGATLRAKLSQENETLKATVAAQERDFKLARANEESAHKQQLEQARLEGELKEKRLISYIFFGGGALLMAIGVVILLTASYVPMFGPKVGFAVIAAGGMGVFMGIVVTQVMKELDAHPWILWTGLGAIILLLTGAGAIAYANHQHHVDTKKDV